MITSRRSFITGLVSFVAAPAIVRAGSLMPINRMLADAAALASRPAFGDGVALNSMVHPHMPVGGVIEHYNAANYHVIHVRQTDDKGNRLRVTYDIDPFTGKIGAERERVIVEEKSYWLPTSWEGPIRAGGPAVRL